MASICNNFVSSVSSCVSIEMSVCKKNQKYIYQYYNNRSNTSLVKFSIYRFTYLPRGSLIHKTIYQCFS